MAYRTQRRVEFRDTDSAGIAHFSCFFVWMEQAEHEALRSLGMSVMDKSDPNQISWPRVSAMCDCCRPVYFEDLVDIELSVERIGTKSVTYRCHAFSQDQKIASGAITTACCRMDAGKMAPIAIPDTIRKRLETLQ